MKPKLLFKIRYLKMSGGIENLTLNILNNLELKNYEIVLLVESNKKDEYFIKKLNKRVKIIYLKPKWYEELIEKFEKYKFFFLKKLFLKIFEKKLIIKNINKYIKNNNVKVFVDYHGESSKYVHKIKVDKKVFWSHFSIEKKKGKKLKRFGKRLNNYNYIITICDEMEKEIENNFPELKEKVLKIYNFIDYKNIERKLEENIVNKEEKEMLKEKYCISVGRLTKQKDHETIIKAFEILENRGVKEKLYIIGNGDKKIELEKMIKEKNLEGKVFLLGYKTNPYTWIKNSDIFIHSAIFEGFGLVLLEAMYLNKPIISSNFKVGAEEIIKDENCGELFEIRNEKELAEKIEKLLLDEKRQKVYIENYYKVLEKYSKEKGIKSYKEFLESI